MGVVYIILFADFANCDRVSIHSTGHWECMVDQKPVGAFYLRGSQAFPGLTNCYKIVMHSLAQDPFIIFYIRVLFVVISTFFGPPQA